MQKGTAVTAAQKVVPIQISERPQLGKTEKGLRLVQESEGM